MLEVRKKNFISHRGKLKLVECKGPAQGARACTLRLAALGALAEISKSHQIYHLLRSWTSYQVRTCVPKQGILPLVSVKPLGYK